MSWRHFIAAISLASLVLPQLACAFEGQDDTTPGSLAMQYKQRTNVWSRFDLGVIDSKITSRPPDSTKFDRRLEAVGILGFDAAISPRFGFRLHASSEVSKRRRSEQFPPRADVEQVFKRFNVQMDATFVTDKGLEIFGGVFMRHLPENTITTTTDTSSQSSHFDAANIRGNHFGVVRRSGMWSGGFFYAIGGESKRSFELTASDGTQATGEDVVFIPDVVGIFGDFSAIGAAWDFGFDFIKAAGAGPRDDRGNTLYTDHFQAKIGSLFSLSQSNGLYTALSHRTLSYSNSAFVELDTMPISTARLLFVIGDKRQSHMYSGLIVGYGKDGQSLPEFNTSFDYRAVASTFGVFMPL